MRLLCLVGSHSWHGCKCVGCGLVRDEAHEWHRCRCVQCGKFRVDPGVQLITELYHNVVLEMYNQQEGRQWDIQMCYEYLSRCGGPVDVLRASFDSVIRIAQFFDRATVQNILKHTESIQELLLWFRVKSDEFDHLAKQLHTSDAVPDVLDILYSGMMAT